MLEEAMVFWRLLQTSRACSVHSFLLDLQAGFNDRLKQVGCEALGEAVRMNPLGRRSCTRWPGAAVCALCSAFTSTSSTDFSICDLIDYGQVFGRCQVKAVGIVGMIWRLFVKLS